MLSGEEVGFKFLICIYTFFALPLFPRHSPPIYQAEGKISFLHSFLQEPRYNKIVYQEKKKKGCQIIMLPSTSRRRVRPISTMEVLTPLLVIFAALSYIDNKHNKK